jgi:hypothetical protein
MRVRIRTNRLAIAPEPGERRRLARGVAALMAPASLAAYALGCWRIASDLRWAGDFAINRGIFSHWQVWIALGIGIQAGATTLRRVGRTRRQPSPEAELKR